MLRLAETACGTVTFRVIDPPSPVQVRLYVVVAAGPTTTVPFTATVPTSGLILQVVVLFDVQVRTISSPGDQLQVGETVNELVGDVFHPHPEPATEPDPGVPAYCRSGR